MANTTRTVQGAADTTPPTAFFLLYSYALSSTRNTQLIISFSEKVSGFDGSLVTVENGTLSGWYAGANGMEWGATFTPSQNITSSTNKASFDMSTVRDLAGNAGVGVITSSNYTIDTQRPTATIALDKSTVLAGQTINFTITFSEIPYSFNANTDLIADNGTLSNVRTQNGLVFFGTYTPTANLNLDTSNLITLLSGSFQDAADNSNATAFTSANITIDTTVPTATIAIDDTALKIGDSARVTVTFSEAVEDFSRSSLSVMGGVAGSFSSSDKITWTGSLTPINGLVNADNFIMLDMSSIHDASGNAGSGTVKSDSYAVDTVRPTVRITLDHQTLKAGDTAVVTFAFSEAVTGFDASDLTVPNGVLSNLVSSDGNRTFTATYTPDIVNAATNAITLAGTSVTDAAGNASSGTVISSDNFVISTVRPQATITVSSGTFTLDPLQASSQVQIQFTEAVTGLGYEDFTIDNGTLSNLTTSDGITWTATLTANADTQQASNRIRLDQTGISNAAGNTGLGIQSSNAYQIDNRAPTATITVDNTNILVGGSAQVRIVFSEQSTGFDINNLHADNGTFSNIVSDAYGVTATFTPTAGTTSATNKIVLDLTSIKDAANNAGSGTVESNNYAIDLVLPTADIVLANSALLAGQSTLVTLTFSEAVTGLDAADVRGTNGTITQLTQVGATTWTAVFTPFADVIDSSNLVWVANASFADLAGNASDRVYSSANYTLNTVRPVANSIVVADTALKAGETSLVTIQFSMAVSGFDLDALHADGGTLSNLGTSDNITWTATLTPDGVTQSGNTVTLDMTAVTSAAGNAGTGVKVSNSYAIDTVLPTASIVVSDSTILDGGSTQVTVTFSEAVTLPANLNLSVGNGTLSNIVTTSLGLTATFTPDAGVSAGTNKIVLDLSQLSDSFGNAGVGTVESNNYAVDTVRPTAVIQLASSTLLAGQSTGVTITFSEAVRDFDNGDVSIGSGSLNQFTTSDNGITWQAVFTPDADVDQASNVIRLANASYTDLAGNTGSAATSANYAVHTERPTATIDIDDTTLTAGQTAQVTIRFSEAVSGFDNNDLSVASGTLSTVISNDGGLTWTATLTPSVNTDSSSGVITLNNAGYTNAVGNAGAGTELSGSYIVDTRAPTATISMASNALAAGASTQVTFTFSEAVSNFSDADLKLAQGTLSALTTMDNIVWTATFTATTAVSSDMVVITLDKAGVTDAAGNSGVGSISNPTIALPPTQPATPPVTVTVIDGVQVQTQLVRDPLTGLENQLVNVAVINAVRDDADSPHPGLADIPLMAGSGADAIQLLVSLPVNTGLQSAGPSSLLGASEVLRDLLNRIHSHSSEGSDEQKQMLDAGQNFLDALADGTLLAVRTLVLKSAPGAVPGLPIIISGSAAGAHAVGLIIDATQLPAGTVIQLDDVDFATVSGPVILRGGLGNNVVVGDSSGQSIVLGPGDDVLSGGAGDDVVGSASGDDRIDGGAGNDIIFGGTGNDILKGGEGNDVQQGGRSDSGKWDFYLNAQGQLVAQHQTLLVDAGAVEMLALSELNHSVVPLAFVNADHALLSGIAGLYATAFGRAPDLAGLNFWIAHGVTLAQAAHAFVASAEFLQGSGALDNAGMVHALYEDALGAAGAATAAALAEQTAWIAKLNAASTPAAARAELLLSLSQNAATLAHWNGANGIAVGSVVLSTEQGWIAGSGDDILEGGAGNDRLVGGDGIDTVVYAGKLADYHIVLSQHGVVTIQEARAGGDIDTILQIEKGQFSDGSVDLNFTNSDTASLTRIGLLYQTVMDRAADLPGLGHWDALHLAPLDLARAFIGSAEFQSRYGTLDNAGFAALMTGNALNHAPDAASVLSWTTYLDTHSRADMVTALIGTPDVLAAQFAGAGLVLV
ncbi:DUF4214 domain-containing protein [Duganella sp. sic0402]|uniref:Ig-like domain-containing protein n=1 Tax=Duganella sp. sic0402 TaxID=2854786 RepID=UPI001C46F9AE|nr:Ig-like domain-containing protein [Duganella sp. sic0402]MBV7537633.1 DUF4214 domain-containing protein [Duganella sp. sic0402]